MWLRWLSTFAISIQKWFYIKVIAAKSNILRNKFALVMGICITLLSNSSPVKTWLSTRNKIVSSTSIYTTSRVQVLPNRKSLDFNYLKSRQMRCYNDIQTLASAAGNPGWSSCTRPKLVCYEAWWFRTEQLHNRCLICYLALSNP